MKRSKSQICLESDVEQSAAALLVIYKMASVASKVFVFFVLTCIAQEISMGQEFKAEGHISYSMENKKFGRSYQHTMQFIIERSNTLWKIRTVNESEGGSLSSLVLYDEIGYDGTNIYYIEQQNTNKLKSIVDAKTFNSERYATALGRVMQADAPRMEPSLIFPIWLALASGPYFSEAKTNRAVAPLFVEDGFEPQMSLPAKWVSDGGAFVSNVTWFSEGDYSIRGPDGTTESKKYPPPYDAGFMQSHFEIADWTNIDGANYPQNFTLVEYDPSGVSDGVTNFVVGYVVFGVVESIHKLDSFTPIPEIKSKVIVRDFRYNFGDQTISYLTSSNWLSDRQITEILQKKHLIPVSFSGLDRRRKIVLSIIIAISVVPLLVFFLKSRTSKKQ